MTMFAEPILATSAEERMERAGMDCRTRDYGHHYPGHTGGHTGHGDTPDHLRDKSYHYSDSDDREVGDMTGLVNMILLARYILSIININVNRIRITRLIPLISAIVV